MAKISLLENLIGVTKETFRNLRKPASMLMLGLALSYGAQACSFKVINPEFVPQDAQEDVYEEDTSKDGSGDASPYDSITGCSDPETFYLDNDGDGFGNPDETEKFCSAEEAKAKGFIPNNTDCDDEVKYINPGQEEVCNGFDDNCDFNIDEGLEILAKCYRDFDGDGFGVEDDSFETCLPNCNEGYVKHSGTKPFDCADENDKVYPGAEELCDLVDNNCKDGNNEGFDQLDYHPDKDEDGAGDMYEPAIKFCKEPTTEMKPEGMKDIKYVPNALDCNDDDSTINKNHPEICDGKDNNCDDEIDNGAPQITYFKDNDGDGYGNEEDGTWIGCGSKPGYVTKNGDCNNNNPNIHPFAEEICNGLDDDCNGLMDIEDGLASIICYVDDDQDGYGLADYSIETCETQCPPFTSKTAGDCNDINDKIHPWAEEICNTLDDNCNGAVDDGLAQEAACDVYNTNLNGVVLEDCVNGEYVPVSECVDPDECAPQPQLILEPCSTDVGICEEGHEKYDCELEDGDYKLVLVEECDGVMPGVEDKGLEGCTVEDLNGLDDDCDGFVDEICNVYIPAGIFNMGCNPTFNVGCSSTMADHSVMLDDYDMGQFEVTNAQYLACIEALACSDSAGGSDITNPAKEDHPVTNVTWQQAKQFCEYAGGNLPTEAQWEKAARGSDSWQMFPWGDDLPNCNLTHYNPSGCQIDGTTEVDDHEDGVSSVGLFNMSGNVAEWVRDWHAAYEQGFQENPTGPENGVNKVIRGGSWGTKEYQIDQLRTYTRTPQDPNVTHAGMGFRCVTETTDQ